MSDDNKTKIAGTFLAGIWKENPVLALMLGMCPTLAVTGDAASALTMGVSTSFVLLCANIVTSLMRNLLKSHLRILMFTLTISTFVTIVDLMLKAFMPDMSAKLGPYIPLIIVNCLIICRAETCASKNGVFISTIDALGMGLGFTLTLFVLASIREIISCGTIFGKTVVPEGFITIFAFALPMGAFVTLGLMLGAVNIINSKLSR
jgi:Na+-translocating ferredoxin:NAD+ oxidoreductase subunit E